jgi:hypothetical protein
MLNHKIVEKLEVLSHPVCKRYVFNTIGFGTVHAVGLASLIHFAYHNRLVQVLYFKTIKKWEQSMGLVEVVVD